MYFKKIKYFLIFSIFIILNSNTFSDENIYAKVINIISLNNTLPVLKQSDKDININSDDNIKVNETLLTLDNQTVELVLYKDDKPAGMFLLLQNSDFTFNETDGIIYVTLNYGGLRVVMQKGNMVIVTSKTVKASSNDSDFCLISTSGKDSKRQGYLTVFGGKVDFESLDNTGNKTIINTLQRSDFVEYNINPPFDLGINDLSEWINKMLFKSNNIPKGSTLILETYSIGQKEEEKTVNNDQTSDKKTTDLTPNKIIPEKQKINKLDIIGYFLRFDIGMIFYDKDIANVAIKFVYKPGGIINDKYEFGFYFPVDIVISKILTNERFLTVNRGNNEWSFGTDQASVGAIIYDAVDDFLLKHSVFRYNKPDDIIYLKAGNNFDVSDFLQYSLVDFNSYAFYPMQRKNSAVNTYKLDWFEAMIFVEDILPKGLYGFDVSFMTPYKSFKFRFRTSAYIDCYDLIKFDNREAYFPAQFNATLDYEPFNVQSLGFLLFISYGNLLPFSNNYYNNTSAYLKCANINPQAIASNMSVSTGFLLRIYDFKFGLEYILDSGLNKIGLFDSLYIAKREQRSKITGDWLDELSGRQINVYDYNFGFRLKVGYNFLENFIIELQYQLTVPKYYDKLYFKIGYDSKEKLLINFNIYLMLESEKLVSTFSNLTNLQLNSVVYLGGGFAPAKGIEINFRGGVYPDFVDYKAPIYCKFMLDCYVSFDIGKTIKAYYDAKNNKANTEVKK